MSDSPVVIVTGAGAGIGRATVELFSGRGYRVVAADISADSLAWASGRDDIATSIGDISVEAANLAMVDLAMTSFGRVDSCVLNAGIAPRAVWEADDALDIFDRVMAINTRGVVLGIRTAAPVISRCGGGSIVVIGSTSGVRADPQNRWAYNASKAAAINVARAACLDWASRGVRVNVLAPGPTETPILSVERMAEYSRTIPLQRLGRPQEQAEAIFFLASPAASFITGAVLMCDGGTTANVGLFAPDKFDAGNAVDGS
jgi:meso-butanediol dehydrogenase/(S,S)-butanediol dehydrogenase/diacetyl reductase